MNQAADLPQLESGFNKSKESTRLGKKRKNSTPKSTPLRPIADLSKRFHQQEHNLEDWAGNQQRNSPTK
jgi:hypothetical protein